MLLQGSLPIFDNVKFKEQGDSGELIPVDLEKKNHLQAVADMAMTSRENTVIGNRNQLQFFWESYEKTKNQQPKSLGLEDSILKYENAILGVQCGLLEHVRAVIYENQSSTYKDKLWAFFRSSAQVTHLQNILQAQQSGLLAEFQTYYSPMMD